MQYDFSSALFFFALRVYPVFSGLFISLFRRDILGIENSYVGLGNYLGLCAFIPYKKKQIGDLVEHITGMKMSHWRLMKTVERGITLCRIFNLREGFTKADDVLPKRFNTAPASGPLKGVLYDPEAHEDSREVYYQMLGWDIEGVPTRGRLVELNLQWAQKYLKAAA